MVRWVWACLASIKLGADGEEEWPQEFGRLCAKRIVEAGGSRNVFSLRSSSARSGLAYRYYLWRSISSTWIGVAVRENLAGKGQSE